MSQYQRILLIADPSMRRTPAFERAIWLARSSGARLHIALFDRNPLIAAAALIDKLHSSDLMTAWLAQRRAWLQTEAAQLAEHGLTVTTEVVWARPSQDEILLRVAEQSPDLVIKDVEYESHLKRTLFTPLDWQLLRNCTVPLLLVNKLTHALPRRVVAAVDASVDTEQHNALNHAVIRQALALAIQCDAELHLVYAFAGPQAMIDPAGAHLGSIGQLYDTLLPMHRRNFEALAQAHSVPLERRHFLQGTPAKAVAEFARADHSDVLVIGSMRHTLVDRMLMGTTAEAILDDAPCNVLAVKT